MAGAGRRRAAAPGWAGQSSPGSPGAGSARVPRGPQSTEYGGEERSWAAAPSCCTAPEGGDKDPNTAPGSRDPGRPAGKPSRRRARARKAGVWGGRERGSAGVRWGDGAPPGWGQRGQAVIRRGEWAGQHAACGTGNPALGRGVGWGAGRGRRRRGGRRGEAAEAGSGRGSSASGKVSGQPLGLLPAAQDGHISGAATQAAERDPCVLSSRPRGRFMIEG